MILSSLKPDRMRISAVVSIASKNLERLFAAQYAAMCQLPPSAKLFDHRVGKPTRQPFVID